jgi:tRNA(Ile)-lysidine synthase
MQVQDRSVFRTIPVPFYAQIGHCSIGLESMEDILTMPGFQNQVLAAVRDHGLLRPGEGVVVAVSGGADSMALLLALAALSERLGIRLVVAHLDHGIRGTVGRADAAFVRAAARRLGLPYVLGRTNVSLSARRQGLSLEMAGRKARYDFLFRAARVRGCQAVATAHTADDQAETVLLRLLRGAGPRGLSGIPRISIQKNIRLIRPLLDLTRQDVEAFLRHRGATWREDASNRDLTIPRNRLRHEILPLLERLFNPRLRESLRRTANILREEDAWLEDLTRSHIQACATRLNGRPALTRASLAALPVAACRRVILAWLREQRLAEESLDFEIVERVRGLLLPQAGRGSATLPGNARVRRVGDKIVFEKPALGPSHAAVAYRAVLPVPGRVRLSGTGWVASARLAPGITRDKAGTPGHLPAKASLDAVAIAKSPLIIRSWEPGDRMRPLGMAGTRKLQDIFTDAKVPRAQRHRIPIVTCRDIIIWIPGFHIAEGWQVRDATRPAVQLAIRRTPP